MKHVLIIMTVFQQKNSLLSRTVLEDKAKAAYLGLAIGDALGATVEFMIPAEIRHKYGEHKNIIGGGWLNLPPGSVTDDTQMSLALGDSILRCGTIDAIDIAKAFSQWMSSNPKDIGLTVRRGIKHYRDTGKAHVIADIYNAGNGACMRTLPIALATFGYNKQFVMFSSREQAHITHNAVLSDLAVEHVIELIQAALQAKPIVYLEQMTDIFIKANPLFNYMHKSTENPSGFIVDTLNAVLQSFYTTHDFESCIIDVVNKGGDADTTGAIAGMIAGAAYGIKSIPYRWLAAIHSETRELCETQACKLIALKL